MSSVRFFLLPHFPSHLTLFAQSPQPRPKDGRVRVFETFFAKTLYTNILIYNYPKPATLGILSLPRMGEYGSLGTNFAKILIY